MAAMDPQLIREWIEGAETELGSLVRQSEELQRRIAQSRVQLGLLYELLASTTNEPIDRSLETGSPEKPVRERVMEAVIAILRDQGNEMRIQDIHAEFLRRRLPLPGSGSPANIAAHLVDRDVFTRPRRGTFGLAEWNEQPS
jgi:hypothetical protein